MSTVLIVDDSEFVRNALYQILVDEGFQVIGMAANGLEAIDRYRALQPDIVTLDITMPILNGLKALKKIRELSQDVVIIVISSLSAEDNVKEIQAAGANFFIAKPFLEGDVREALKRHRSRH